ncbi:MAG: MbnH family di-heme enzyme [Myxococcota bacterium]
MYVNPSLRNIVPCIVTLGLFACGDDANTEPEPLNDEQEVRRLLNLPDRLATPHIPEYNPLTAEKIELGRHLFYDPRLSVNETTSCASCHEQHLAFADGEKNPMGATGEVHPRNSQGLANVAYNATLTWANDGLLLLEDQIQVPLRADNPIELGITDGVREMVLARFDDDPDYAQMFAAAFPESDSGATVNKIAFALASFVRTMISVSSPYDRFLAGESDALTEQQKQGLALFNGERFECFHCHSGTLFTTSYRDANTTEGTFRTPFFNNGLYNIGNAGDYPEHNQGLYDLTFNPEDRGLFRPPSLRNVELTEPYMHDGSIATLREVVEHYAAGGRVIEEGPFAGDGRLNPNKSGLVRGFQATDEELDAVVAFLEALTDPEFITNPAFSDPFAEPQP